MKKIFLTAFAIAGISLGAVAKPMTGEIHVNVKGMVCGFCVQGLTKTFKKQKEVDDVKVSLEGKFVHLKLKKDQTMDSEVILNLIREAGYEGTIHE